MSRYLVLWVLVLPLFALAQEATEDEAVELPLVDPCAVVEGEAEPDPDQDGAAAAGEDGEAAAGSPLAEDCERDEPADSAPGADAVGEEDAPADGGPEPAKMPEDEGDGGDSDPDEEDFTPSEEISEDYPVPLPSDI